MQTGLVLEYRRLREREARAGRARAGRRDQHRRCCAPSPTTCGRRSRRCAPRSTACVAAATASEPDDRHELRRHARRLDRPARAAHRQPARPVPAADRAGAPASARRAASRRSCRSRVAGHPPSAVDARPRRVRAAGPRPTPGCWSGWWRTWSPTRSRTRRRTAGAGRRPACGRRGRACGSSTAARRAGRRERERMFEPFQRLGRRRSRRAWASGSRWPAGWPRPSARR